MNNLFKINDEVVRTKDQYHVGYTGRIIEVDEVKKRVRVAWYNAPKTWVRFDVIALTSIPYEIRREEFKKKGYSTPWVHNVYYLK